MMTQMTSFSPSGPFGQDGAGFGPAEAHDSVRLKRVGARPLVFEGEELCMAMSYVPGAMMWFEINIWRCAGDGFAVAVKQFYRDEERVDTCRAWQCDGFEEVLHGLEEFDPAQDLEIGPEPAANAPATEIAAAALSIRAHTAEARRQYRALVGEVLYDLEHG